MQILTMVFTVFLMYTSNPAFAVDEAKKISTIEVIPDCHAISDTYLPDGFSQSDGDLTEKYKYPRIGWRVFGMEALDPYIAYVKINVDEKLNLQVIAYDKKGNILIKKEYSKLRYCNDGWLISNTSSKGGSGETGPIHSFVKVRFGKAKNGSLIVHSSYKDVRRKWIFWKHQESFEIWTVYQPKPD